MPIRANSAGPFVLNVASFEAGLNLVRTRGGAAPHGTAPSLPWDEQRLYVCKGVMMENARGTVRKLRFNSGRASASQSTRTMADADNIGYAAPRNGG